MIPVDYLIHAKWLIPCEDQHTVLENYSMALADGKILAIVPTAEANNTYHARENIDYAQHVVMPGLVNCHTHLPMNLFRGLADDLELMDWLNNYIWPAERKVVSDEFVYDGARLAMAEMIKGGITCFNDMFFYRHAIARAAEQVGMRAHIGIHMMNIPSPDFETPQEYQANAAAFCEKYRDHALIQPTLAPHSTYTTELANLAHLPELAERYNLQINIHLQENAEEVAMSLTNHKLRPLQRLDSIGLVSPRLIAIHMTQLDERDLAIIAEKKPNIVHCPESNLKLVCGICPIEQLHQLGINVAIGTDSAASNNDLDLFSEMRTAALIGKLAAKDPKAVSAGRALLLGTQNGAAALGKQDVFGTLSAGKSADFIAINLDDIDTIPIYHPISQLIYSGNRKQVSDSWVHGKQLMKNRKLLTLDEKELFAKAQYWSKKIKNAI